MSCTDSSRVSTQRPAGEELPLVVRLDRDVHALAAAALAVGAAVVGGSVELAALAAELRGRFGRCYALAVQVDAVPSGVRAGIAGTALADADPWAVALVVGALRDAGLAIATDADARGGGTTDALQGITVRVPATEAGRVAAAIGALADGLRVSKC